MVRSFNLMLTGNPREGRSREEAAAALAKLMHLPEAQALELLSGRETVVKRGLDGTTLHRYLEALHAAGVETRKEEIFPEPAAPATVECPACGEVQPDVALCRKCGTNMHALRAAQAEAARNPSPRRAAPAVAITAPRRDAGQEQEPEQEPEIPRYRRRRWFEILLFLFASALWGILVLTDKGRSKAMRAFGGVTFAVFGTFLALEVAGHLAADPEREEVLNAVIYANEVTGVVGNYAIAHQRMPERTVSIDLPAGQPDSVKSVAVGQGGQVRVVLSDGLKEAAGGVIVMTPVVEKGVIDWKCSSQGVPAAKLDGICN